MEKKKIISRGAEGVISITQHEGEKVVSKLRVKKSYRHQEIDDDLRKTRTKREARLLNEAQRAGVLVPRIIQSKDYELLIQFIDGVRVKDFISEKTIKDVCTKIGSGLGRLHQNNLVHGDVTTSNMIWKDGEVYFIDFGLGEVSSSVEMQATDLYVLEEALKAAHFEIWEKAWKLIIKSYEKSNKNSEKVLEQLKKIKLRARYMERIG